MGSIHNPFALLDDDSDAESTPVIAPVKEQKKEQKKTAAKKPAKGGRAKHSGKDRQSASGRRSDGPRKGGRGPHGFGNKNNSTQEHIKDAEAQSKPRRQPREQVEEEEPEEEEPEGKSYDEYLAELKLVDSEVETRAVNQGSFKGIKDAKVAEVVYDFDEEEELFRLKDIGALKKPKKKNRKEKKNLAAELLPSLGAARGERPRREFNGERRGAGRGRGGRSRGGRQGNSDRQGNNSGRQGKGGRGFNALALNERDFPSLGK